jgi:ABC-type phosphate transport system substrate-binding protein
MTAGDTASADPAPSGSDIVGVGSDTLQYMLDFGADGAPNGDPGYNVGHLSRVISFDATPDGNARAGYLNGSTSSSLKPLNPTIVLRSGKSPVQRPNGSGAGINALIADTGPVHQINFVRSSSPLNATQAGQADAATNVGPLREVRLGHDGIHVATADTTNAVALSKAQLKQIYLCATGFTKWNDAGVGGTSNTTIIPIIPQFGSGTRKTFLQDIGFAVDGAGNSTPALGGCVKSFEENDPYALYVDSSGVQVADPYATSAVANPDAIEPMSDGRLNLYAAGYFQNPNLVYGQAVPAGEQGTLDPTVKLLTAGTPSDSTPLYVNKRGLYVIFRNSDVSSSTKFNGGTKNWVNTLFFAATGTPFFKSGAGQGLLAQAGIVPDYSDCGVDPSDASTCAPFNS